MQDTGADLVRRFEIRRIESGAAQRMVDTVATEEPLEVRLKYWFKDAPMTTTLALTMRTPGRDREFTAGYLLTEGIVHSREEILEIRPIGTEPSNEIVAALASNVDVDAWRIARTGLLNSSCGICGKRSLDGLAADAPPPSQDALSMDASLIESLPDLLRAHQDGFDKTGGLHAAALVSVEGVVTACFEDIGRHNALDKLIGHELLAGRTPLANRIVFLSSRSSFELIQKASMAGAPVLATVGGPSSLAIETARACGMTLIGFVRDGRFNVYSGEWRIRS